MKIHLLGSLLLVTLVSCVFTSLPEGARVVASAHEAGQEPRQIHVEAAVDGDLFPKVITLADHEASVFVGKGEVGHETGESLLVECVDDLAHLTLIEHRADEPDREVWSGSVPIEESPGHGAR